MLYGDISTSNEKIFECFRNGHSGLSFELRFRKTSNPKDLIQEIEKHLNLAPSTNKVYRFFNQDGVEISIDEFDLLKTRDRLFVSEGEDFEQISMLAEYKMVRQLGQGGFGKVMLATHRKTGKKVAIKIVDISKFANASDTDMIYAETETLKTLHHNNIVKILNCFTMKDMKIAFVMEYLEGGELFELVREKRRLSEPLARIYFKQLIEAIGYCHRKKLIHRDLKLENILLVSKNSETIKVVDFGIAGLSSTIKIDAEAGSLKYMPPEVLSGASKAINPAIDIWALGCILFGMVCGQLPFNGSSREVIRRICNGDFAFPSELEGQLSEEVKDLIKNILILDPAKRYTLTNISAHPWIMGEKLKVDELVKENPEETKEKNVPIRVPKVSFNRPRSESVKVPGLKKTSNSRNQCNNQARLKKGSLLVHHNAGGDVVGHMGANPVRTIRNSSSKPAKRENAEKRVPIMIKK